MPGEAGGERGGRGVPEVDSGRRGRGGQARDVDPHIEGNVGVVAGRFMKGDCWLWGVKQALRNEKCLVKGGAPPFFRYQEHSTGNCCRRMYSVVASLQSTPSPALTSCVVVRSPRRASVGHWSGPKSAPYPGKSAPYPGTCQHRGCAVPQNYLSQPSAFWSDVIFSLLLCLGLKLKPFGTGPRSISESLTQSAACARGLGFRV
jgi:hypothetical protein